MKSWKTTVLGILTIIIAVATAGKLALTGGIGAVDFAGVIPAVMAGVGLIFARDNDVSSEQAGAK